MALTDGKRRALPVAFGCSARRRTYIDTPEYKGLGLPMRLFRTPGAIRMPPQPSAAQTDALLAEFGVSEADARALIADEAFHAVRDAASAELLGVVGVHRRDGGAREIGYWFAASAREARSRYAANASWAPSSSW